MGWERTYTYLDYHDKHEVDPGHGVTLGFSDFPDLGAASGGIVACIGAGTNPSFAAVNVGYGSYEKIGEVTGGGATVISYYVVNAGNVVLPVEITFSFAAGNGHGLVVIYKPSSQFFDDWRAGKSDLYEIRQQFLSAIGSYYPVSLKSQNAIALFENPNANGIDLLDENGDTIWGVTPPGGTVSAEIVAERANYGTGTGHLVAYYPGAVGFNDWVAELNLSAQILTLEAAVTTYYWKYVADEPSPPPEEPPTPQEKYRYEGMLEV